MSDDDVNGNVQDARDHSDRALHRRYHRTEATAARLLVIITGAYTIVAGLTLCSMRDQTRAAIKAANAAATAARVASETLAQTRAQATAESTAFTEQRILSNKQLSKLKDAIDAANRQADASNRQAVVAAQSLKESEKTLGVSQANFTSQQRPYLWVNIPQFVPDEKNGTFTAQLQIANYGRGAAENAKLAYNIWHDVKGHAALEADAFFAQAPKYWTGPTCLHFRLE